MTREDALYWIWLSQVMEVGSPRVKEFLYLYGDGKSVYEARFREDLSPWLNEMQLERLRALSPESCLPILDKCEKRGISLLPYGKEGYPRRFLEREDAPVLLYATGDPSVLNKGPVVGLVGSRRPSAYGLRAAQTVAKACAEAGCILVSGLAEGLDSEGHKAAVEAGTPTAAFLGTAIDTVYPATNRGLRARMELNGAVLSEYAPGEGGQKLHFLQRNRLIAAACDVLCVAEARYKSGTMSTVQYALKYGKPVFAVPGEIFSAQSEGTNLLIAQGKARPILGPETLPEYLAGAAGEEPAGEREDKAQENFAPEERQLAEQLLTGPKNLSQLCEALGKTPGELLVSLTRMELAGRIRSAGGVYALR